MANQTDFFKTMQPYAMTAGAALGIPYQVIVGQWALESAYGTSDLARRSNNYGGIKYTSNADFQSGSYSGYNSVARFVNDYIRVMRLPYYEPVRNAGGIRETIEAFGKTPYAEDSSYVSKLKSMVNNNDTSQGVAGNVAAAGSKIISVFMHPIVLVLVVIYLMVKKK